MSLNLKKFIFCVPYGILLGHVVCKQALVVNPIKIIVIINLDALTNVKKLRTTFGNISYYWKFIKAYV